MFKVEPVFKDYLWGGNKLREEFGKKSDLAIVAESWELSTHPAGVCAINVDGKETLLTDYIAKEGKKALGTKSTSETDVPILIKLIDAKDNLSVQVHPDDEYARKFEGDLGKTEMWYVLEAEEGAKLVYGFQNDLTTDEFKAAIESSKLEEKLNYVDVKPGDVFFITPGTMHAIGKGIVIAEIQESSNVTYRVYDYGRVGADGKPRELHVAKAIEVTKLNKAGEALTKYEFAPIEGGEEATLVTCGYFTVKSIAVNGTVALNATEESFHHVLVVEGEVTLKDTNKELVGKKGDSFFIPANSGKYEIAGNGKVVLSTL